MWRVLADLSSAHEPATAEHAANERVLFSRPVDMLDLVESIKGATMIDLILGMALATVAGSFQLFSP